MFRKIRATLRGSILRPARPRTGRRTCSIIASVPPFFPPPPPPIAAMPPAPTATTARRSRSRARVPKVGCGSLGCPKALVDSERILTQLRAEGYEVAPTYDDADVVVVNTCGFIDAAVDESLDAIGEALEKNGRVIVTGCLGARPERILARHPRVLKVTGAHAYEDVMHAVHEHVPPRHDPFTHLVPPQGIRLTPRHYAYLKISEGCNNRSDEHT